MLGRVSVIIPNWNGSLWIEKCILSLLAQTYVDKEIIIVDNASQDDSLLLMQQFADELTLIINQKNEGFSSAINKGIEISDGKYVFILNNDAWIDVEFLAKAVNELHQSKVDVLGFTEAEYQGNAVFSQSTHLTVDFLGHPIRTSIPHKNFYLGGHGLLFRKDIYIETGGLDSNFFMYVEEVDWFWRLNLYKIPYKESQTLFVHHKQHGSTEAVGKISYLRFLWRNENTLMMLVKNYSALSLWVLLPCYVLINLCEIMYFILTGKYKIVYSYIVGPVKCLKNITHIRHARQIIQKKRSVNDLEIFKKMYFGSAKLMHLWNWKLMKSHE